MGNLISDWKHSNINIRVNINNVTSDIQKVIGYFKRVEKSYRGYLTQINPTTIQTLAQKAATVAMKRAGIRVQGASQDIIDNFYASVSKKDVDTTNIRLSHYYFSQSLKQPVYERGNREDFKITGQAIYRILDTGRKSYTIIKRGNQTKRSSPLKFFWRRMSRFMFFYWKGPKGGIKRLIKVSQQAPGGVNFRRGARFTEAAQSAVETMMEIVGQKMLDKSVAPLPK